jgi:hypothetical protein
MAERCRCQNSTWRILTGHKLPSITVRLEPEAFVHNGPLSSFMPRNGNPGPEDSLNPKGKPNGLVDALKRNSTPYPS